MAGPYVYQNPMSLVGRPYVADVANNYLGQCVSLVKHFIPGLQNRSTSSWIEGDNVVDTLRNGGSIPIGTAIATFRNGRFISGSGHACFYAGFSNTAGNLRIIVVDQYLGGQPSGGIISRPLRCLGKNANGNYVNPSNNAEAFSVII